MGKKKEADQAENIKVVVRCRPINSKEKERGFKSAVDLDMAENTVTVNHVCGNPDRWTFDGVVNNTFSQKDVFTQFIMPMVDSMMDGFNATIFAYGQSGSGKTHTMTGVYDDPELMGVTPRCFAHVFSLIKQQTESNPNKRFTLYCSYLELYNGKVRDLLCKEQKTLSVKENKDKTFFVQGLNQPQVKFPQDLTRMMEEGTARRVVEATELNSESSRSHSIFTLIVECTVTSDDGDVRSVTSKLNLVDLAGSERQSKTGASGDTLKEGCNINLSLSALGTVIDTLVKGKGHIPFRSSPLTMLLKDSLGGCSKTCMFANCGPSEHNVSETVSTLRFADRAKQIKNKPVVMLDTKDQKIAELSEAVNDLKEKLKKYESGGFGELEEEVEQLREKCGELEIDRDNHMKGRETDAEDAERAQQQLQQKLSEVQSEKEEIVTKLSGLQEELKIAEQLAHDEATMAKEIFEMCSQEFGTEIASSDDLVKKVREVNNGVSRGKFEEVQSQANDLHAELDTLRSQFDSEQQQWKNAAEKAQEDLTSNTRKVEKLKEQLSAEQNARKQMISEVDDSPGRAAGVLARRNSGLGLMGTPNKADAQQLADLNEVIQRLEEERDNNTQVKQLEQQLSTIRKEKEATLEKLREELAEVSKHLTAPQDNESLSTEAWKKIVKAKDDALVASRAEVDALEQQVDELRHLRMSAPGERRRSSSNSLKDFAELREQHHQERKEALEEELEHTVEHRDQLLAHVIRAGGSSPTGDSEDGGDAGDGSVATQELQKLAKENKDLRLKLSETNKTADKDDKAILEERKQLMSQVEELKGQLKSARSHSSAKPLPLPPTSPDSEVAHLKTECSDLRQSMEAQRKAFEKKEKQLLEAMSSKPSGEDGEATSNPLQAVVEQMHSEKTELADEVARLRQELSDAKLQTVHTEPTSSGKSHPEEDAEERAKLTTEVSRLQDLLSSPAENESQTIVALKNELKVRHEEMKRLHRRTGLQSEAPDLEVMALVEEQSRIFEEHSKQKVEIVEMEKQQLLSDIESLKVDLAEHVERRSKTDAEYKKALQDISDSKKETTEQHRQLQQSKNEVESLKAEMERAARESGSQGQQMEQLENRVTERTEQLKKLRATLENQKGMMDKMKGKLEQQQQTLNSAKQELSSKDAKQRQNLQDQAEQLQRAMNKKIEAISEEHHKALAKKDDDMHSLRKKMKKLDDKLDKAKAKYDEKVCEYAELQGRMEEQKMEQLQLMREQEVGTQQVHMEKKQEEIANTLKTAKEDRKRKQDLFANGEVTSALTNMRAVGNVAVAMSRSGRHGAGGNTPPTQALPGSPAGPMSPMYSGTPTPGGGRGNMYDF